MKRCYLCGHEKPLNAFVGTGRFRFGATGWCAECRALPDDQVTIAKAHISEKECSRCHHVKPLSQFSRSASKTDGYKANCKTCVYKHHALAYMRAPDRGLRARLKTGYGMTPDDLQALGIQQDGKCAICDDLMYRPVIDHDHATGVVRGLLCFRCNSWLAPIENAEFLKRARAYLAHHEQPRTTFKKNANHFARLKAAKALAKAQRSA